ncbi:MAG: galactose mutarotase [Verrucomicrobia bacterium]|nr:galactose mutarotase [Verrucomicrobiota bacterium]
MQKRKFGSLPTGEDVELCTLHGGAGASLSFMSYGGIVTSLCVPDREGRIADVVLGFDNLDSYVAGHPFFGAVAGRVAGRIPGGRFTLEGKTCQLVQNDGPNHLHGGLRGLDKRIWSAKPNLRADGADSVRLTYHSPDGEEGYPGNAFFCLDYTLTQDNVFIIESEVTTDRLTPICLTHHSYFNLAGEGSGEVFDHELTVHADRALLVDELLTPLGRAVSVAGTAADFSSPRRLGDAIPGLFARHGDCYLLPGGKSLHLAARLADPVSGRTLSVSTNEHCLQLYTAAYLECPHPGKSGHPYLPFAGCCLECQGYSAGAEFPEFGSILVEPGRPQRRVTRYAFSTTNPGIEP